MGVRRVHHRRGRRRAGEGEGRVVSARLGIVAARLARGACYTKYVGQSRGVCLPFGARSLAGYGVSCQGALVHESGQDLHAPLCKRHNGL